MLNKKSIKVLNIIVIAIMLLMVMGNAVFATVPTVTPYSPDENVNGTVGKILGIIQWGGIVAAVAVAMFIGIKYITASPDGKAEIKKTVLFYVLGIVILLSASGIVTAIKSGLGGN